MSTHGINFNAMDAEHADKSPNANGVTDVPNSSSHHPPSLIPSSPSQNYIKVSKNVYSAKLKAFLSKHKNTAMVISISLLLCSLYIDLADIGYFFI